MTGEHCEWWNLWTIVTCCLHMNIQLYVNILYWTELMYSADCCVMNIRWLTSLICVTKKMYVNIKWELSTNHVQCKNCVRGFPVVDRYSCTKQNTELEWELLLVWSSFPYDNCTRRSVLNFAYEYQKYVRYFDPLLWKMVASAGNVLKITSSSNNHCISPMRML